MLICMKLSPEQILELKDQLSRLRDEKGLTYAAISQLARVHPSQVWRICAGEFHTKSNNVVQVCKVLGIETETITGSDVSDDPSWRQLEQSLRNLWDQTPKGAQQITRILEALESLRSGQL